jgi:methionine sulfoxide reductase catalytic subunit
MLIKRRRGFDLPEREVTPEWAFLNRRELVKAAGFAGLLAGTAGWPALALADEDPTADLYPVEQNPAFEGGRPLTDERMATRYNNFYEFGSFKEIWLRAQALETRPWTVEIAGLVEEERTVDIDTLIRAMPLEERIYRLRCVEAWAITVPWSGFPMRAFLDYARPLGSARYVAMTTFYDRAIAPGQRQFWYPWPYQEGLTIEEAANELSFLVTGAYGKPLPKQMGAPLRLSVPWKYGFKWVKSIVRFEFTEERPETFWEIVGPTEYGFWANVNPDVDHPRWSQAEERLLGTSERVPTQIFNGYGEYVAHLYEGIELEGGWLYR